MLKSLSEFQALTTSELTRIVEDGPILITDDEEPRFVAQSVEDFEAMVRRLRNLEEISARRRKLRLIHPRSEG
jgi:PHD/YefM family antitoxin component YafN of YafNO toxin-antitoxin module